MEKSFAVESVEALGEAGSGKFEALVSVFGNVDAINDVVMPRAFEKAIKELDPPPIVWSHFWHIPPIGDTIDWSETDKGLRVQGQLFVGADDKHQYADMVYAAMKSRDGRKAALREFSFSYEIPEDGMVKSTREVGGQNVVVQELHTIFPVSEVGPTLKGCNSQTELLVPPKSRLGKEEMELLRRISEIAEKRGKSLPELVDELEAGLPGKDALSIAARAMYSELMLAMPDH